MPHTVLVIEDNRDIAHLVQLHLQDLGYLVDINDDGARGLAQFQRKPYDLVVLDLMLPGKDGLEVCRELRRLPRYVPILMLTAKSAELDRVIGLETGADDYLTKPFGIPELQARVKALFRRVEALGKPTPTEPGEQRLTRGALSIDVERRQVTLGERELELTAKEFDLLLHFARHPGRVFNRAQLLDQVWGYNHTGYEHTVNSHINRLRSKLEKDPANPDYILTVWGVGYKFAES